MAAELYALVHRSDNAFVARDLLQDVLGKKLEIDVYVDSRKVFNVIAKRANTLQRRH